MRATIFLTIFLITYTYASLTPCHDVQATTLSNRHCFDDIPDGLIGCVASIREITGCMRVRQNKFQFSATKEDLPPKLCKFIVDKKLDHLCVGKSICNCMTLFEMLQMRGYYEEANALINKLAQMGQQYCY